MSIPPVRLARFAPLQIAGLTLMAGAVLVGAGLFAWGAGSSRAERTVQVVPAQFPHLGTSGPVVAVFGDANCPHCRAFESVHMPRLLAAKKEEIVFDSRANHPAWSSCCQPTRYSGSIVRCSWS